MKNFLCLILSFVTLISFNPYSTYASNYKENMEPSNYEVYSPEYPDAYIIINNTIKSDKLLPNNDSLLKKEQSLGEVTATVFIKESYELVNGSVVTTG